MSTTTPYVFPLEMATLDAEKLATIVEWYHDAQGNEDKASDVDDNCYYAGERSMLESVLALLCNIEDLAVLPDKVIRFSIDPRPVAK